jgi:hypothetical protein
MSPLWPTKMKDLCPACCIPQEFFPVMQHNASIEALKEGWPFPMSCCWNGLVVLNAEPFRWARDACSFRGYASDKVD